MILWPLYDFNIIPIKIISSIYELFFHLSDVGDDDKGTYYTPLHLVDNLLDEVYPWEWDYEQISIIDPSCGSGIFLVEAYRRIVCRWMQKNNVSQITNSQLNEILKDCIFELVNTNLIVSDFFDEKLNDKLIKYDIIIGNPPWQSQLTKSAIEYLKFSNHLVGDKQIAQAFSIKCATICKDNGVVCLLMPSKGFLFNRSPKSSSYSTL